MYVIVGGLVTLSLGLYIVLMMLNSQKKANARLQRKARTTQGHPKPQSAEERRFAPNGISAE